MDYANAELLAVHEYQPAEEPRVRTVVGWSIMRCNDTRGHWFSIWGVVSKDVGGRPMTEGANLRFTQTSPVKSIEGNVATTQTGSVYTLEGPPSALHWESLEKLGLGKENPLPFTLSELILKAQ